MKGQRLVVAVLVAICMCMGMFVSSQVEAEEGQYVFKVATMAPKNVGWAKHIRGMMMPIFEKKTNNEMKIKWYWGGVMGDDKDCLGKMKIGQLDGAALTGQGVFLAIPEMSVLGLPFMFENYDEVDYVRKKMFFTFEKYAKKNGFRIMSWSDQDFDQIYSVKYPMDKLEDFKKAKIITWFGVVEKNVLQKLGASPIPVGPVEVTPSIRQGIANTGIAPAVWVVGAQMYTTFKYVNPVNIRYSPAALLVTTERWNAYPELARKYEKVIHDMQFNELMDFCKATRKDSKKALEAMIKRGMKETHFAPAELKKVQAKGREVWDELAGKQYPKELLDELKSHLKEYRAKK